MKGKGRKQKKLFLKGCRTSYKQRLKIKNQNKKLGQIRKTKQLMKLKRKLRD